MNIIFALVIPLVAAVASAVSRNANVRDIVTVIVAAILFYFVTNLLDAYFLTGIDKHYSLFEMVPGLSIALHIEPLGLIFALIVAFLWGVTSVYSIGYMRGNKEEHQNRFYTFFALSIFAALGIAFAANVFTLFIFYELLTLFTYPLVTHSQTDDARRAGRIYLGVLMGASLAFFLPAVIITYLKAGSVDFVYGGILTGKVNGQLAGILFVLFMFGIGKAALMPFHKWLPAAMVAPTPVSALLHAVAVVKAGVFSIVKIIVYLFGIDYLNAIIAENWLYGGWLLYVAGFTIICASVIALFQDNLKRRLAYSTVSQLSYVILAAAILAPKAIIAAAFHIAAHAFSKITLFFAAGSIYTAAHKQNISQLNGIGRKMPWTMAAFTIGAVSMIGIPPTVGFISKWYIFSGAFTKELYFVYIVLIASTVLNAAYFIPIIYRAFFLKEERHTGIVIAKSHGEAPWPIVLALVITATITLLLFFFPSIFLGLAKDII